MARVLYRSFLPLQRELSHTRTPFQADFRNRMIGVSAGQGTAEFVQRARLKAARSGHGDERADDIHGLRAAVAGSPRTNPIVHQHYGSREEVPFDPGQHLVRRSVSLVLGVRGPADERQAVFAGNVLSRWRHEALRGPQEAYGP